MVVYLDLVLLLNVLSDALALYITARLAGVPLRRKRLMIGTMLGGIYGLLASLPQFIFLTNFAIQFFAVIILVWLVFGREKIFLRMCVLFYILSCTVGGAIVAFAQSIYVNSFEKTVETLEWKVFLLVGILCYFVLSVVFRGGAKHAIRGQICKVSVSLGGRTSHLDALYDTGHTLCDPYSGMPVLTVWHEALHSLWSQEEMEIFDQLSVRGSVWCAERLHDVSPGKFHLIPYRAVGVGCAMLLAVQADMVSINGEQHGKLTLALSPTSLSDGEGYTALWGGERGIENAESNPGAPAPSFAVSGTDLSR